jgi:multiple antibiotic resistance protein
MIMGSMNDIMKFGISMYSVLNPLGAIPIFLTLTQWNSHEEIRKVAVICSSAVCVTLLVGIFLGNIILTFFGISIASFRVGGGVLIALMAIQMMNARSMETKLNSEEIQTQKMNQEIGIVPLAIPLLAGPGSISTSIIHANHFKTIWHWIGATIMIILISISIYYILHFSRLIGTKVGKIGLNVMTRIMGLILMALSVEFISSGIKEIFSL